jgi:hypothetical protein
MEQNGNGPARWLLVVKPEQRELFALLRERLEGSGIEVLVDRRRHERRRGSFGPGMDRRVSDRRRQRPLAQLSLMTAPVEAAPSPPAGESPKVEPSRVRDEAVAQRCPTCAEAIEHEMPRFPHPPARVEMEVAHMKGNGREGHHYVEIAAFTVSGRLILSQRVPARRSA